MSGKSGEIQARFSRQFGTFGLDVNLTLPSRGITIIFGGSGSGKTSLLRCVAGLEPETKGYLSVDGDIWQDDDRQRFVPTYRRPVGYVFQDAVLFPHLSVEQNLRFGLSRVAAKDRQISFDHAIDLLSIRPLLGRKTKRLSGGEQQRVGMARAILTSPRLLLMDEPLAALDQSLKDEILPYLERLHDTLEIPILYVTHSIDELTRLGDHLVLMDDGKVAGQGKLQDMLGRLDHMCALGEDPGVVIETTVGVNDTHTGLTRLDFQAGSLRVPLKQTAIGSRVRCRVLPSDVSLTLSAAQDSSVLNILPATVAQLRQTTDPTQLMVQLDMSGIPILARITRYSGTRLGLAPGLAVYVQIKAVNILD